METKFTPGPWNTRHKEISGWLKRYGLCELRVETEGNPICQISSWQRVDQQIANCNLIAAAPELLEALQDIDSALANLGDCGINRLQYARKRASAAIAKATGE